jgi:uncharacterized membrane protein
MSGQTLVIVLRLFHIVGGVFWVGSVAVMAWFLLPAQNAAGREGSELVRKVLVDRKMGMFTGLSMAFTLISGIWLMARYASASGGAWMRTPAGTGFGIGASVALLAVVVGIGMGARNGLRQERLRKAMEASGPTPAQEAEMRALQRITTRTAQATSVLLLLAAAVMATARYWG